MKYLAIDIGASSGKMLEARPEKGKIITKIVHRFENRLVKQNGHLCWDIRYLEDEILEGLKKAKDADYISIDTWAVDYVLLDKDDRLLSPAVSYRDSRTENISLPLSREELYKRTGIQFQRFNTIYQLAAQKEEDPSVLDKASSLLFIPDYLAFRLTGEKVQEYTNATTTDMVKASTKEWDSDLIGKLGFPPDLFGKISMPGTILGPLRKEVREMTGCNATFILAPTHDTACAVLASPLREDSLFLSSGTWSLLGCINENAITSNAAMKSNFTNEGADNGMIRFLKNIMGTWMLQNIRKESGENLSFDKIVMKASKSRLIGLVDALSPRFLSPSSMSGEIDRALEEQGLGKPSGIGERALVVYHSLANAYKNAIEEISNITGRKFSHLAIVGGGSRDDFLNRLTRKYTGLAVTAGPDEGSAAGCLLSAMIHTGEIRREDIPSLLSLSFDIKTIQED